MMLNANTRRREVEPEQEYIPRERLSGDTIKKQIKLMLFKDPATSAIQIIEQLAKRSVALSKFTVEGIRADTRHTLKLLKEQGMLADRRLVDKL
jgi:hypothetical protein